MIGSPNALALLVLALWPLVAWALVRRLGLRTGIVAGLVGGYLLLPPPPAGFELPLLPPLTKDAIPLLAALGLYWQHRRAAGEALGLWPRSTALRLLLLAYLLSPLPTMLANPEPVVWGTMVLPGQGLKEALGAILVQAVLILPFLLARALLAGEEGARLLLRLILLGALLYSPLMLAEVRLAPQLNIWIYGFFQHDFGQMMREGGFRPIVFLYHGLWVALLAFMGVFAAAALLRDDPGAGRARLALAALWMALVLFLCKSLGSLVYALAFAPVVLLVPPRGQVRLAALLALLAVAYPVAKGADLVPQEAILALAERVSAERAQSLGFRFAQEEVLLARAAEKPAFGWGLWGRHLIYDARTGRALTIADGRWIILMGSLGWVGFLAEFGLLAMPVWLAWARMGAGGPPRAVAACALLVGVSLVDLIPNATVTPLTWLLVGATLGWAERAREPIPREAAAGPAAPQSPALPGLVLGAGPRGLRPVLG